MKRLVILAAIVLLTGCATSSTNWQTTTGQTLEIVAQTTEAARESYIAYCNANNIGPNDSSFLKAQALYVQYQNGMQIAENAYVAACANNNTNTVAIFENALSAVMASETNILILVK